MPTKRQYQWLGHQLLNAVTCIDGNGTADLTDHEIRDLTRFAGAIDLTGAITSGMLAEAAHHLGLDTQAEHNLLCYVYADPDRDATPMGFAGGDIQQWAEHCATALPCMDIETVEDIPTA